jgi:hypothetical protein
MATVGSLAGLGLLATGPAMAGSAAAGPAKITTRTSHGLMAVKGGKIPISSLSPTLRTRLDRRGARPGTATAAYWYLENESDNGKYCLDANDSGSTAGKNGDKVQLWTCKQTQNQAWVPVYYDGSTSDYITIMENVQYPSECLNANDSAGLSDGSHVQLYSCADNTTNAEWNFGAWFTGNTSYLYLYADYPDFVLDATAGDLGDGDQIQIYNPEGRVNQYWR